ncbi:hypothetical protein CISG_09506 [Coccidioides immitis RMSCC 3703]|uniref:Uncharacterized protein n=1 Tax=Coccidioides immitis RMSCC 3703 TaxID=454286 RepID=A0A0J8QJE1_COCIT|nr:hypothetical protein CISG_09506 [Coccidioides immitis RMSCC 3703]
MRRAALIGQGLARPACVLYGVWSTEYGGYSTPYSDPTEQSTEYYVTLCARAITPPACNQPHSNRNPYGYSPDRWLGPPLHLKVPPSLHQNNAPGSVRPPSPLIPLNLGRSSVSPHGTKNASMAPSSPGRQFPSSPRTHSPASSQIFERSVQEDIGPSQTSPAIPSHIMTENHIPPILDASSAALTDVRLDPDSVEIITHNFHQPASLAVSGHLDHALSASWCDEANSQRMADVDDSASNYGAPHDPTDVRRLSFVSFADVVHGELAETADHISVGDSTYVGGLSTFGARNRSPSPFHSPVSSSHGRACLPNLGR